MLGMEIYFWQSQISQAARIALSLSSCRFDNVLFFVDPDTTETLFEISPWEAVDDALAHPNFGNLRRVVIYPRFPDNRVPLQHRCMEDAYRILLPRTTSTAPGLFDPCELNACLFHVSVLLLLFCSCCR